MISKFFQRLTYGVRQKISTATIKCSKKCALHTLPCEVTVGNILVNILPALEHNYMYLVVNSETKEAVAIDPVAAEDVLSLVKQKELNLNTVLITHHHDDHAGGNCTMKECLPNVKIFGGDVRINPMDCSIKHFDILEVGNMRFRCLYTPGHTTGHYCFFVESMKTWDRILFLGDAVFSGGIGPILEGTPCDMYNSLCALAALPDDTITFGGHEFTVKNLEFACKVEPENLETKKRLEWARDRRDNCLPAEFSTICQEKLFNPFFRVHLKSIMKYAKSQHPHCIVEKLAKELYQKKY